VQEEAPVPDALVGQHLGEYVVCRLLGSGGMGRVYEGEHLTIGRKVAIKLLREEHAQGAHPRGLLAEARAASAIRHHGIIEIFGVGQQPGVGQYLVMEYLEGRPLHELLQARAPLPLAEAFALLAEVLDALSAAHAVGVIHRDLKPSNIFVARQSGGTESIKLLDFGLAKRSASLQGTTPQTHSDVVVGTPQYMAPEQALCEEVGPQTDLYAVGVIAFELLTGQRPFNGRSPMEIVAHHLRTPPPAPSLFVELPPEADALVLQLLAKEPHQRPGSASEVARKLRALRDGLSLEARDALPGPRPAGVARGLAPTATLNPVLARSAPVAERPLASPRRGLPWQWGAVAGGVLALVAGARVVMAPGPERQPSRRLAQSPAAQSLVRPALAEPVASAPRPGPAPVQAPGAVLPEAARPGVSAPAKKKRARASPPPPAPSLAAVSSPSVAPQPVAPGPAAVEPVGLESAAPPVTPGTLHLVMKGTWADVWVDGHKLGRVPPTHHYTLTAGEHELELRNPAFASYRRTLVIPSGGRLQHIVDLGAEVSVRSP
jgi:hypothetical protein